MIQEVAFPAAYRTDSRGLPVIETDRLVLRLADDDDVESMVRFRIENADHLAPWEPKRSPDYFTQVAWKARLRQNVEEAYRREAMGFVLFPIDRPREVIGVANLRDIIGYFSHSATLGYSIDSRWQGRGLMTEACRAVIWYGFEILRLHRIEACYMPTNHVSGRVLQKLGFVVEGTLRKSLLVNGQWEDHVIASLINEQWSQN